MPFKDSIDVPPTCTPTPQRPLRVLLRQRNGQPPPYEIGDDPDYRFSLANERTFLAWIRTSLALLVASIAAIRFVTFFGVKGGRELLALSLLGLSLMISVTAYGNWANHERAIRLGHPLPAKSRLIRNVALGLSVVFVLALVLTLILIFKKA